MDSSTAVLAADKAFFSALLTCAVDTLDRLLLPDFVLVDVMRGAEVPKPDLLAALTGGQVHFERIDVAESRVRLYGDAAVVTGRTLMKIRLGEDSVEVSSRYTHVFVRQ